MATQLIEDVLEVLGEISKTKSVREIGKYRVLSMIFDEKCSHMVSEEVEKLTRKYASKGEVIRSEIEGGEVIDLGETTLKILGGVFIELYDYEGMKAYFMRVYRYKGDEGKWISLYVDENPETPWWSPEERGLLQVSS